MRPRRGFGFPLALIAIGLVALLANLGVWSFSLFALLSLWPLVLVLIGIDLLLGHRAPLAALALDVVVVGVGIALLAANLTPRWFGPNLNFSGRDCPSGQAQDNVAVARDGAQRLSLSLIGAAGTYQLAGGAAGLVEARSDAIDLYARTNRGGDRTEVRLTQCTPASGSGGRSVEVKMASDLPTSLELTGGAGSFQLDLREVRLTDARITSGASSVTLSLPRPSGDVSVRLTGGASSMTIDLGGAEARVEATGGLTTLNSPGTQQSGFGRSVYESAGYAAARDRYTITVTGGVSSVNVR